MASTQHSKQDTANKSKAKPTKPAPAQPASAAMTSLDAQSAQADPLAASPAQVLQLQQKYGNRAVQRLVTRSELESKAQVGMEGGEVQGDVQRQIDAGRGGGQPLDKKVGDSVGGALGADFSNVHVHTDSQSDTLNRSLNAQAFTTGSDIYFSQGKYNPGTSGGKQLLAHELTHVVQQGGQSGPVQTKLTVGAAGDKYEQEADDVASKVMRQPEAAPQPVAAPEEELGAQRSFIQLKSDKLKAKTFYTSQAKGGFKLFGTPIYTKVMNAIDVYHGINGTDYQGQLQQLCRIAGLLTQWEIEHGHADTAVASKNAKETARRGVLAGLKSTDLPEEIADVYQQAKTNGDQMDIHLLAQLMDAAHGNSQVRGPIEADYATALRQYQADAGDSGRASGILNAQGSSFLSGAGGGSLGGKVTSLRGQTDDPSDGQMDLGMLDAPIAQDDSDFRKQMKKARLKLRGLVPALANMSDIEIMAIGAYTDEGGYTPMNQMLRGGHVVRGGSKAARKGQAKLRAEVHQANLMAASALNKLPNWDGSPVFRGEDVSWLGIPTNGMVVVLKSFTSTAANIDVPRGFASKGGPTTSAVWEINGVVAQGKDISKLSLVQQDYGIGTGMGGGAQEDEVLLRPYTRLRIDNVTQGPSYRYHIEATAL